MDVWHKNCKLAELSRELKRKSRIHSSLVALIQSPGLNGLKLFSHLHVCHCASMCFHTQNDTCKILTYKHGKEQKTNYFDQIEKQ